MMFHFSALYGAIFSSESEAAFSNYRMWESFGFIIAFAYSNFLCTRVKLIILMNVLIVGMAGYLTVEFIHHRMQKNKVTIDKNDIGNTTVTHQTIMELHFQTKENGNRY